MSDPIRDPQEKQLIDLVEALDVEVMIDHTNKLWVNVSGKCLLRIGHVDKITLDSPKLKKEFT
jgi:hypothetical protein